MRKHEEKGRRKNKGRGFGEAGGEGRMLAGRRCHDAVRLGLIKEKKKRALLCRGRRPSCRPFFSWEPCVCVTRGVLARIALFLPLEARATDSFFFLSFSL